MKLKLALCNRPQVTAKSALPWAGPALLQRATGAVRYLRTEYMGCKDLSNCTRAAWRYIFTIRATGICLRSQLSDKGVYNGQPSSYCLKLASLALTKNK